MLPFPKWPILILVLLFHFYTANAQQSIFELMDRTDLVLSEVEQLAEAYFEKNGTGQGSGFKQYQRWLYERKFHVDGQGRFSLR